MHVTCSNTCLYNFICIKSLLLFFLQLSFDLVVVVGIRVGSTPKLGVFLCTYMQIGFTCLFLFAGGGGGVHCYIEIGSDFTSEMGVGGYTEIWVVLHTQKVDIFNFT